MAKRRGANTRKKNVQWKKKVGRSIRKGVPFLLAICAAAGCAYGIYISNMLSRENIAHLIEQSGMFTVRSIAVKGNLHIKTEDILAQCGLSEVTEMLKVSGSSVKARLSENPWIEQVHCLKRIWGKVVIEIQERVPIALINNGDILLVDRSGVVMPMKEGIRYELPLISGLPLKRNKKGELFVDSVRMASVCRFLDSIEQHVPTFHQTVPQFDMSNTYTVRGNAVSPRTIVEMDYSINGEQLRNVRYMLSALASRNEIPDCINVQYQNLAFVTMKTGRGDEITE